MSERHPALLMDLCWDDSAWPVLVSLLGDFRLLLAGTPIPTHAGGKSETLLAYLALQSGRRAARERLVQALWPDSDPTLGLRSLNTLVYNLHKLLGPALQGASPVLHEEGYYRLNEEAGIGIDVACFDLLVETADQQRRAGDEAPALRAYRRAAEIYRDDLSLVVDGHSVVERERLRARYLTLLAQLAEHYYQVADYSASLAYLWRLLAHDHCREDAHRLVMRCHVRRGERAAALHQYQVCMDLLREEFGLAPEPATMALLEQIRSTPDSI